MFALGKVVFRSPFVSRKPGDEIEVRQTENKTIATLRATVESQRRTIIQLEHKVTDLGNQNEDYRKSKVITPEEEAGFKAQSKLINDMQDERNQLAIWLRMNKPTEIAQGLHNGIDLIPLILKYLGGVAPEPSSPLLPTPTPEQGKVQ